MIGWGPATKIYLAAGATDMRKGFDGLYGLVRDLSIANSQRLPEYGGLDGFVNTF